MNGRPGADTPEPVCRTPQTMLTQTSAECKDDASIDFPSDATKLGVDGEDSTHYYSRIADAVAVQTPNGTVERRESLEDRKLATWIVYVDDKRGWRDLNYAESFADILLEALRGDD